MRMPNQIDKLHFIYLIVIFILIIGFISGTNYFYSNSIVNILSISSALISIVIGGLAIFIAVYQGLTQGTSIQKINESAERVEKVTKELEDVKEIKRSVTSIEELILNGAPSKLLDDTPNSNKLEFSKQDFLIMLDEGTNFIISYILVKKVNQTIKISEISYLIRKINSSDDSLSDLGIGILLGRIIQFLITINSITGFKDVSQNSIEVNYIELNEYFIDVINELKVDSKYADTVEMIEMLY